MGYQGTRRRESGCPPSKRDVRFREPTAAGKLQVSSISTENISSESANIGCTTPENARQHIGDTSLDNSRVTMRTRIAVRDKTPHRFQVVPLRDAGRTSGHNFYSTENRPPFCATPVTPKKSSNQDFSAVGRKYKSDLTTLDAMSPKRMSLNRKDTNLCDSPGGIACTPALSTDSKRRGSVHSSIVNPSTCPPDRDMTLSERGVNLIQKPKALYDFTSQTPSPLSVDSIHELIRSESPLTQTISRSLRYRTTSVNVTKSSSLNNMTFFNSQQADTPSDGNNAYSQRLSQNLPVFHDSDDQSYYGLLDAYKTSESTSSVSSNKRHAIYTPSVYGPYCDEEVKSGPSPELGTSSQHSSDERGPMHKLEVDHSSDDDPDTTIRPDADIMDRDNLVNTNDLSTSDRLQGLKHKSSSRNLPLCIPRGLNHSKPLYSVKNVGPPDGSRPGALVYPRIVLSLFAELDNAINEWNQ